MSSPDLERQPTHLTRETGTSRYPTPAEAAQNHTTTSPGKVVLKPKGWSRLKALLKLDKIEPENGYTTHSFNGRPIPVANVFNINPRVLITLRVAFWVILLAGTGYLLYVMIRYSGPLLAAPVLPYTILLLVPTPLALLCQLVRIHRIGIVGIPTLRQLWYIQRYPQRLWEMLGTKILFPLHGAWIWWFIYLLVSDFHDFEVNFLTAWSRQPVPDLNSKLALHAQGNEISETSNVSLPARTISDFEERIDETDRRDIRHRIDEQQHVNNRREMLVFSNNSDLKVPVLSDNVTDSELLGELRMFYRYLKVKRGLPELLIPRNLFEIHCVIADEKTRTMGEITGVLDRSRGLRFFHNPKDATNEQEALQNLRLLKRAKPSQGVEFVRALDRDAIGAVILLPPLASLAFVIIWLSIYLSKLRDAQSTDWHDEEDESVRWRGDKAYSQQIVGTAFTVASYIVTAGSLITALAALLDDKPQVNRPSWPTWDQRTAGWASSSLPASVLNSGSRSYATAQGSFSSSSTRVAEEPTPQPYQQKR